MCYPPINEKKQKEIIDNIDIFFKRKTKKTYDVKSLLNEINNNFVVDFNQLKFSIKNDENKRFTLSEDLCTIFINETINV
jgi:hypothetical protein